MEDAFRCEEFCPAKPRRGYADRLIFPLTREDIEEKNFPKEILRRYGKWEAYPRMPDISLPKIEAYPEMTKMQTMYEGPLTYLRFWNFWVRAATVATNPSDFFRNYESGAPEVWSLINAVGALTSWPKTEEEIWSRISTVSSSLQHNVIDDSAAYGTLVALSGGWPSIDVYAQYYVQHSKLVWSACFSKAHLFSTLLGRVLARWHVIVAEGHHTEGGAPPTASHVYIGYT